VSLIYVNKFTLSRKCTLFYHIHHRCFFNFISVYVEFMLLYKNGGRPNNNNNNKMSSDIRSVPGRKNNLTNL